MALLEQDVLRIRGDFPALAHFVWFQNGGMSVIPAPVAREHAQRLQENVERGPVALVHPEIELPRRRRSLERLADFFAVDAGELALTRGVSEAFQTVLRGLPWKAGDRILITADEEAALLLPCLSLRDRFGVEVVKAPLVADVDGQLEAIEALLTRNTRLLAVSHVTTDLGYRLPVARICRLARRLNVPSFVDLAHSAGTLPISLRQMGCDFAGLLSYKWMYAPYAMGALFVRREQIDTLEVTFAGGRAEKWLDFERDTYELHDTAERFQYGPWSWPLVHAWAAAASYLEEVGLDLIWRRTVSLADRLKKGLKSIPGSHLYTPESPELSGALVSFSLTGWRGAQLAARLRERWKIIIKPLPNAQEGLRASLPFFLLESEIDQLLEALAVLAGSSTNGARSNG